jgi:hypothetical protein
VCRGSLIWCNSIFLFLILFPGHLELYSENNSLCLYLPVFSYISLYQSFRSYTKVFDSFWINFVHLPSIFCWRGCLFSNAWFGQFLKTQMIIASGSISESSIVFHWSTCLLLCQCLAVLLKWICRVIWWSLYEICNCFQ